MALGLIFLRQRLHAGMCEACSKSRRRLQKKRIVYGNMRLTYFFLHRDTILFYVRE